MVRQREPCRLRRQRGSRPRPLRWAASHPPLTACGPSPCPPWAAAWRRPPRLLSQSGTCGGQGRAFGASRPSWPPAVARGAPLRKARPRQAACGGPCFAPPPRRLRRRCSGAARPPLCGGCGAVRPSGPALRAGVAARRPSLPAAAKPGRRLRPAALPLRGAAILTPRAKVATPFGLLLPTAHGARLGRGVTPAAAGYLTGDLMPRPSPCGAACSGP